MFKTQSVLDAFSAVANSGILPAASVSDTINNMTAEWTITLKGAVVLACIAVIIVVAVKSGLSFSKILMTSLVAAFVIWAVVGEGLVKLSSSVDEEISLPDYTLSVSDDLVVVVS